MQRRLTSIAAAMLLAGTAFSAHAAKDVVVAVASTFTTTDPYDANDTLSQAVAKSFYEGLYGFDKDMKMVPVLATGFEVSKDGLVYTFKLRSGVKFHDGTPFNAEAVKQTFERVINPDNKLKRYNLYKNISKIEAVDDLTAKFTLKEPFAPFVNSLAHPSGVIISPAALKQYGKDIVQHPVGTGPFKFVEWKPSDYMKVAKFDGYWQKGLPKVDSITWRPVVDNNTRASMMQTNEAHFAFPVPPEAVANLEKKPSLEVTKAPSIIHRYISMNVTQKPFDNPKVREALNYAINKEALSKVAFAGSAIPAEGVLPKGVEFATKLGPWPYDPAKAKALLKEAGYPNGFESTLWSAYNHSTAQKVIQFAQQQLAQVGVKVTVRALEAGQRVAEVESVQDPAKAAVRMYYVGWSSSTGEADWAMRPLLAGESAPPRGFNTAYYNNAEVNADIAKALVTTDTAARGKIYADAQQKIWKDAPWIFLNTEQLVSVRAKNLSGFYVIPDGNFNFVDLDLK
ncbi:MULTISPECIES: glutathione ABC transporter substrate-binding protein GsiB [Burkholderiales]|uniref:Glutathione-binding protein GsiB n=1 Tax=Comamonas squillarum TaxID=2977320 RepID=A0ABY5ZZI5_9BURK|nr:MULTISPECIES: glutathione ABC transporter substrate-binding protein GsiB [Burkholderiales]UXC18684.1 glutathione ABC transporter substrate-binding protein GsiB [Comamonas sp. PR12]HWV07398.1 glutathione ABC transporter substrate-binding protein GsiB [Ralstonia sp.]